MQGLYIGLSKKAKAFISGDKIVIGTSYTFIKFTDGEKRKEPPEEIFIKRTKREMSDNIPDTDIPLYSYTFSNSQIFDEVVQEERETTAFFGQKRKVYFTALRNSFDEFVKEYTWTPKEIEDEMRKL